MKKGEFMIIKANVHANLLRVLQLIEDEGNLYTTKESQWGHRVRNNNNVELRQRMKLLRKDMVQLEKMMKGAELCENKTFQNINIV